MKNEEFAQQTLNNFVITHLSDEELAGYHDGIVDDEITRPRMEAHLQRCLICQRRLEFLQEVTAEAAAIEPSQIPDIYHETARRLLHPTRETLRALREGVQEEVEKLFRHLEFVLTLKEPQFAFATPGKPLKVKEGKHGVFVKEDPDHNLIVRFGSKEMALEGRTIRFYTDTGEWHRDERLKKVRDDQVGAEVVITRDERKSLPSETVLRAEIVDEEL